MTNGGGYLRNMLVKLDHFPRDQVKIKMLETTYIITSFFNVFITIQIMATLRSPAKR